MKEKNIKVGSGYVALFAHILLFAGLITTIVFLAMDRVGEATGAITLVAIFFLIVLMAPGYFINQPNESKVLILFGKYVGTVSTDGFYWANPFYLKKRISLRARNLTTDKIKVNDRLGNPIIIGAVVVWRVENTAMAAFEVDDYEDYVNVQSEAAVRNLAGAYSYDAFDDAEADITLRGGGQEINEMLEKELSERLELAGVEVMEARITHLAYASEIAGAMLQRQQATAVVAARFKIVEGAVSMVKMALDHLKEEGVADFDEEKRAAMISNLMVVLCAEKSASPIVNTGTLYQ
jgi:regulator of protease activity HflC (stomatin/prohibitin superfamily)